MSFKSLSELYQFSAEKMKKNSLFETSRVQCDVYCLEPGQEQKAHTHDDQDKIYVVLEGQGLFSVGGAEKSLSKDSAALAKGGEDHGVKNPGPERLVLLVIVAPPGGKKEGKGHGDHGHHGHEHGHGHGHKH